MTSETNFMSAKSCHSMQQDSKDRISNVTNDSESFRLSDYSQENRELESSPILQNNLFYKKFFQEKIKQPEITQNLHKKAINWLITFCWTRSYSEQILWYSIGYYYSYSFSNYIKKDQLTLIRKSMINSVISAINLSLKLFEPSSVLGFEMMKSLLNNTWSIEDFRRVDQQLMELFEFDLYFPTVLTQILSLDCSEEHKFKILFLAQCLFMNSYEPAINDLVLEDIQLLINEPAAVQDLKKEIMKLQKQPKIFDVLKQKFSSKFNIDNFLIEIIKEN